MNSWVNDDTNFVFDADVDDNSVYLMGKKSSFGYEQIEWGDFEQQQVAKRSKWSVWGVVVRSRDPSEPLETPLWTAGDGFTNLLENAMTGCEVARKALRDLVKTNPDYEDWKPTVEALGV